MRITKKNIGLGIVFTLIVLTIITVNTQFNREYEDFLTYKRALTKTNEFVSMNKGQYMNINDTGFSNYTNAWISSNKSISYFKHSSINLNGHYFD